MPQHKEEKYHKYRQGAKGADAAPPYSQHPLLHPCKFHAPVDKVVFCQCAGQIIEKAKYKTGDQHADQQIFQDLYRSFFPLIFLLHIVSLSPGRLDILRVSGIILQLFAKVFDMCHDRSIPYRLVFPDALVNIFHGEDLARCSRNSFRI